MTRITQISTATLLVVLASSAFVSTAEARAQKKWCEEETVYTIFRTSCEGPRKRRSFRSYQTPTAAPIPGTNFRGRTSAEFDGRDHNGGNEGGNGNGNGNR